MRIVTWNVNGIKTVLDYHPWRIKKTYKAMIEDLGGDITCIQETKITRQQIDKGMACIDSNYDSFFSFYRKTSRGIHGTAIFTKKDKVVPLKAEEGIGSSLLPANLTIEERIGGYPLSSDVDLDYNTMKDLDNEGRTTIIDTGMFVLINLYCPNEGENRLVFKNQFNSLVDRRVRNLIKAGREVIVVGDLNICASELDTAEPDERAQKQGLEQFTDHPPRAWLKEFTGPNGPMVDTTRAQHPDRKGMFTCWNTKINARPSNYGTRLDYILVTRGLLPWIKDADIQRDIQGSDHCPVYVDLHDSIEVPGRGTVHLWEEMNPGRKRGGPIPEPPSFACKFYDEFSGKQRLLSNFFGKGAAATKSSTTATSGPSPSPQPVASTSKLPSTSSSQPSESSSKSDVVKIQSQEPESTKKNKKKKGKAVEKEEVEIEKPVEKKKGQQSLSSFFLPPPPSSSEPEPSNKKRKKSSTPASSSGSSNNESKKKKKKVTPEPPSQSQSTSRPTPSPSSSTYTNNERPDDDDMIIVEDHSTTSTSQRDQLQDASQSAAEVNAQAASVWQNVFAPKAAPLCEGHKEPTKMWTVNKPGINKGRKFYLCARPVGPGYDKGQAKINVNPEYRCDHFEWATKVLRPAGMVENMNSKKASK
ncbi:hypothetical protein JCM3765_001147 [Sporobolomyces pararoseus]